MENYEYVLWGWVIVSFVIWIFMFHEPFSPDFCIFDQKSYLLSCVVGNQTIAAISDEKNLDLAMNKNNCTIVQVEPEIKIDYCNKTIEIPQYKIDIKDLKP